MGFYGSVYYQLIDTFYKFIVENNGYIGSKNKFPLSDDIVKDLIETEASGRKGTINLDIGNRWLSFTKDKDTNKILLWHNSADDKDLETQTSFTGIDENKRGGNSVAEATQLEYGDKIAVDSIKYDKAGHIAEQITKYFVLPQNKADERLDKLEDLVIGDIREDDNADLLPDKNIKNLYEFINKNYTDNNQYHNYIGEWPSIHNGWSPNETITSIVGNLDDLFTGEEIKNYQTGKNYHSSLVSCIGDMSQIAKDFKSSEKLSCSISDALHEFKKEDGILPKIDQNFVNVNTLIEQTNNNLNSTNVALQGVDTRLDVVEQNIGKREDYSTIYNEITNVNNRIGDLGESADVVSYLDSNYSKSSDIATQLESYAKKEDYLSKTDAENTYLKKENFSNELNTIISSSNESQINTLSELLNKIADLETRVSQLEGPATE